MILLRFTQLIRIGFSLNMFVCHLCLNEWGRNVKIRVSSCWGMGEFVLLLSNINIVWQKSLRAHLMKKLVSLTVSLHSFAQIAHCKDKSQDNISLDTDINMHKILI